MIVRNLIYGDVIPEELKIGFTPRLLSPEWVWVAVEGMKVVGILIAFCQHGWFLPHIVWVLPSAPRHCLNRLLRKAFRDARARGIETYLIFLLNDQVGRQLLRILESRGETVAKDADMVCIGGRIGDLLAPSRRPMRAEVA
jgi:hypothetical protein